MLALGWLALPGGLLAQQQPEAEWDIESLGGASVPEYDFLTGLFTVTNRALVRYSGAVLTADRAAGACGRLI